MRKKRMAICLILVLIISFGFGYIKWYDNENMKMAGSPDTTTPPVEIKKASKVKKEEGDGEKVFVQLRFPNAISYPGIDKFDITVFNYPAVVAYCSISSVSGNISAGRIYLKNEKRITYHLPSDFDRLIHDKISFKFYDDNQRFITEKIIAVEYDNDKKMVQIFEMEIE